MWELKFLRFHCVVMNKHLAVLFKMHFFFTVQLCYILRFGNRPYIIHSKCLLFVC